uniref:Protein FIP1 isoform X1 n=1 Tax=Cicer arietinum TaxID=3827 RepID=A0A1S3EFP3_CICAR|nr:protein FIP1 isoform X1 [Cicer arietinum]
MHLPFSNSQIPTHRITHHDDPNLELEDGNGEIPFSAIHISRGKRSLRCMQNQALCFDFRCCSFLDILHEAPLFAHRKAARVVGSVFYCILLAGYATLAVGAQWIFRPVQGLISPVLCSCDVLLLLLTGIFQQYLVYQVQKIRLQGYYSFSQKLKFIVRIPFAITAYGTAAMLLVIVWKPYTGFLSISAILRIIMVVEALCAGCFMSLYIGYIHQYNSLNSHPDVLKSLYSPLQPSSSLEGLRYHDGRLSDQQMALLQYQRENLHFLSEEILRLQESLSKYERTDDRSTPQVDLAHLLAARDQELRTISAEITLRRWVGQFSEMYSPSLKMMASLEHSMDAIYHEILYIMNQVQSELRLARSLIAERDSEVQRVRTTNNQYVEENERLRAILGEWSTRAAKLERALEAERMSNLELQRKVSTQKNQAHMSVEATEQGA